MKDYYTNMSEDPLQFTFFDNDTCKGCVYLTKFDGLIPCDYCLRNFDKSYLPISEE